MIMKSNLSSVSFLIVGFLIILFPSDTIAIKDVLRKIAHPIKSLFGHHHYSEGHGNHIHTAKHDFSVSDSQTTTGLDCNRTFSNGVKHFKLKLRAIYPGTKWCGDGNISKSYDDLGRFSSTDSCCREHDLCPDSIPARSSKYGLKNTGLFTRSHCDCDRQFYQCLKSAGSIIADSIGYTYFTILKPQCFQEDYPVVGCDRRTKGQCTKYLYDSNGEKVFQWIDSPVF